VDSTQQSTTEPNWSRNFSCVSFRQAGQILEIMHGGGLPESMDKAVNLLPVMSSGHFSLPFCLILCAFR
jgi:hypothetical protein